MSVGKLFVVSAPSGAGKTTLLRKVMDQVAGLAFSISHTTRMPRPGETDGKDYYFVNHEKFEHMIATSSFLEFARVHGNYYGTSKEGVARQLAAGLDVILDIDVQGAAILRQSGSVDAAYIFVAPPNMVELERRLRSRGTETEERIGMRLQNARVEMQAAGLYEYLLVNDRLEEAIRQLLAVILAERAKGRRRVNGSPIGDLLA
jgi:guanylate kinase